MSSHTGFSRRGPCKGAWAIWATSSRGQNCARGLQAAGLDLPDCALTRTALADPQRITAAVIVIGSSAVRSHAAATVAPPPKCLKGYPENYKTMVYWY